MHKTYGIMQNSEAIIRAAATARCIQHLRGECRDQLKSNAYKHGKTRRYSIISTSEDMGIFKLIFKSVRLCFLCRNAETLIF